MQKPDISKLIKRDESTEGKPVTNEASEHDALFEMDGFDEVETSWTDSKTPKTFAATELGTTESVATLAVQKISAHNDFRPIDAASVNLEESKPNGNGKKKKKTRKVGSKKKHQRKSSSSSVSSQSDRAGSEQRTPQSTAIPNTADINFYSDNEVTTSLRYDIILHFKYSFPPSTLSEKFF